MDFGFLDGHLLDGAPPLRETVERILAELPRKPTTKPFVEGIRMLRARVPELTLIALRLALAGGRIDDARVARMRELPAQVRAGRPDGEVARQAYRQEVGP